MKIMKSQIDASLVLTELAGYRSDANVVVRINRVALAGETAWATDINGEIRYWDSLAKALNCINDVIREKGEQKQLLRAL